MTATAPASTAVPTSNTSTRRVLGLARANLTLLMRNKLTAGYALILPLLPLALLLAADRGSEVMVVSSVSAVLLTIALFPAYYNLLSATVTRRDELVLKRLRTGEATDGDLLVSLALPGFGIGVLLAALAVPIAMALGAPAPVNPVFYLIGVVVSLVLFTALAFWTAAWTRNAEAAQMTSFPVIILAVVGTMTDFFPERARAVVELTPGAALQDLVTVGWIGRSLEDDRVLTFAQTWGESWQPLLVMGAWTVLALVLAARSMQWEPRH